MDLFRKQYVPLLPSRKAFIGCLPQTRWERSLHIHLWLKLDAYSAAAALDTICERSGEEIMTDHPKVNYISATECKLNDIRLNSDSASSDPLVTRSGPYLFYPMNNSSDSKQRSWISFVLRLAFEWHFRSLECSDYDYAYACLPRFCSCTDN